MCKQAKELQDNWDPTTGDFIFEILQINPLRGTVFVNEQHTAYGFTRLKVVASDKNWNMVWLPRQDQLQEILTNVNKYHTIYDMMCDCYEFGHDFFTAMGNPPTYPTFEQLWLAFVMEIKYKKEWNGETWINQ